MICDGELILFVDFGKTILKQLIDFLTFLGDFVRQPTVLPNRIYKLFEHHYCNDIQVQLPEILVVQDVNKVADVSVDKLENEDLVDHRIFKVALILMILAKNALVGCPLINYTKDVHSGHIDKTRHILPYLKVVFFIDFHTCINVLNEYLSTENHH